MPPFLFKQVRSKNIQHNRLLLGNTHNNDAQKTQFYVKATPPTRWVGLIIHRDTVAVLHFRRLLSRVAQDEKPFDGSGYFVRKTVWMLLVGVVQHVTPEPPKRFEPLCLLSWKDVHGEAGYCFDHINDCLVCLISRLLGTWLTPGVS